MSGLHYMSHAARTNSKRNQAEQEQTPTILITIWGMVYTKNVTTWECFMKMIVRSGRWPKKRKENEQGWKIENREGMNETVEVGCHNEETAGEILLP